MAEWQDWLCNREVLNSNSRVTNVKSPKTHVIANTVIPVLLCRGGQRQENPRKLRATSRVYAVVNTQSDPHLSLEVRGFPEVVTFYLNMEGLCELGGFRARWGEGSKWRPASLQFPSPGLLTLVLLLSMENQTALTLGSLSGNTVQIFIYYLPGAKRCFRCGESDEDRMCLSSVTSLLIS